MGFSIPSRAPVASALLLYLFLPLLPGAHGGSRRLYIVYLGDVKHGHPNDVIASHHDILSNALGSMDDSLASMVYNYKHGFSGFAAMLTEDHAHQLAELPEVISVHLSRSCRATTTRSWDFLGMNYQMPSGLLHRSRYGEDIIIGVVDTGCCRIDETAGFSLSTPANKVHTFQVKLSPLWRLQGNYTFGSLTGYNNQKKVWIPIAAWITMYDLFADDA